MRIATPSPLGLVAVSIAMACSSSTTVPPSDLDTGVVSPVDSGTPPTDLGTPPVDAGTPRVDVGIPPR